MSVKGHRRDCHPPPADRHRTGIGRSGSGGPGPRLRPERGSRRAPTRLGRQPAVDRDRAQLRRPGRGEPARQRRRGAHDRPPRCPTAVGVVAGQAIRQGAGRCDGQPGSADGQGRAAGDLPVRLAGGGGREPGRRDLSRPVAVPRQLRALGRAPDQQRSAARRPDQHTALATAGSTGRVRPGSGLPGADRRRRGGRLRRPAERLRVDEVDDRRRGGGGALRGPVGVGEEVRASRREGAGADRPARQDVERGPARRRHQRRADAGHRTDRRARRDPADQRRRPDRRRVLHRRAHRGGILPSAQRHRAGAGPGTRPTPDTPTSSGSRPEPRTSAWPASSPPSCTATTRESYWPTTVLRRSTGKLRCPTNRSRRSPTSSATWDTPSSSSPWPGSTRSTTRCSTSRPGTPGPG